MHQRIAGEQYILIRQIVSYTAPGVPRQCHYPYSHIVEMQLVAVFHKVVNVHSFPYLFPECIPPLRRYRDIVPKLSEADLPMQLKVVEPEQIILAGPYLTAVSLDEPIAADMIPVSVGQEHNALPSVVQQGQHIGFVAFQCRVNKHPVVFGDEGIAVSILP